MQDRNKREMKEKEKCRFSAISGQSLPSHPNQGADQSRNLERVEVEAFNCAGTLNQWPRRDLRQHPNGEWNRDSDR